MNDTRYSGVILDTKLNENKHFDYVINSGNWEFSPSETSVGKTGGTTHGILDISNRPEALAYL